MIIKSLADTDLYKLTMMQLAFHQFPNNPVKYRFKCRTKNIDLRPYRAEIQEEVCHLDTLRFTEDELNFLLKYKAGKIFKPDFINFLRTFKLDSTHVKLFEEDDKLQIEVAGSWVQTILFEIYLLSIVNEVYFRNTQPNADKMLGLLKLDQKIKIIKDSPIPFKFTEFGTRRRYSREWQETVVRVLNDKLDRKTFMGTSNIDLARRLNLPIVGSQAHELFQFAQSLSPNGSYFESHKLTLDNWVKEYDDQLLIALSDIFGTDAFLSDFTPAMTKKFDGLRQDSGSPFVWADKVIAHYKKHGIDPLTKLALFSDGLDMPKALEINKYCHNKIDCAFGIGTTISNDLGFPVLNIVIKMVEANGMPVVKISDEPSKAIGDKDVIEKIKKHYGIKS